MKIKIYDFINFQKKNVFSKKKKKKKTKYQYKSLNNTHNSYYFHS